jgi:hypothetical protein
MADPKAIREKFGLGHLFPQVDRAESAIPSPAAATRGADVPTARTGQPEATGLQPTCPWLASTIRTVLGQLQTLPDHTARLHDLVARTGIDLERLLEAVQVMAGFGQVTIVRKDKLGNHTIRLPGQGRPFPASD